jgi:hypothetical protein
VVLDGAVEPRKFAKSVAPGGFPYLRSKPGRVHFREDPNVNPTGTVFPPDLIERMKAVLDDATAALPEAKRTSAIKAEMACSILAAAAKGERNSEVLRTLAIGSLVDRSHYSHDISPERRVI